MGFESVWGGKGVDSGDCERKGVSWEVADSNRVMRVVRELRSSCEDWEVRGGEEEGVRVRGGVEGGVERE